MKTVFNGLRFDLGSPFIRPPRVGGRSRQPLCVTFCTFLRSLKEEGDKAMHKS